MEVLSNNALKLHKSSTPAMQNLRNTANTTMISSGSQQIFLISNRVGSVHSVLVLAASTTPFLPCKK